MAAHSFVDESELGAPLEGIHAESGARFHQLTGEPRLPRHYGDPASEYQAAASYCAMVDRSHRSRWKIEGRDPARMLNGILTNTIPPAPEVVTGSAREGEAGDGASGDRAPGWRLSRGRAPYGLTLTPKGKVVSDHRLLRLRDGEDDVFLLDIPAAGTPGMRSHFQRFLPPRFATVVDLSRATGMISVVGPEAPRLLGASLGELVEDLDGDGESNDLGAPGPDELSEILAEMEEGDLLLFASARSLPGEAGPGGEGASLGGAVCVIRSDDLGSGDSASEEPGRPGPGSPGVFDVLAGRESLVSLWALLREQRCAPMGQAAWEILRIEGGRPVFGADMDDDTIPVEAGVHDRAIDYEKGCYTGQEVIVRIRDRGRVNRHLRRFLLGERPTPTPGTEIFREDGGRPVGWITSAVDSPRFGQVVALGYARREVEPPARVRLGSAEGPLIDVRSLEGEGEPS